MTVFAGYDAYQVDRKQAGEVEKPPVKVVFFNKTMSIADDTLQSSVRVMTLIHSLCVMLRTTPFHRENYSRLIVGVIVQYYQQCSARFKGPFSLSCVGQADYLVLIRTRFPTREQYSCSRPCSSFACYLGTARGGYQLLDGATSYHRVPYFVRWASTYFVC